jgi:hypothetical protein
VWETESESARRDKRTPKRGREIPDAICALAFWSAAPLRYFPLRTPILSRSHHLTQFRNQLPIFFHCAYGNADPFRQIVAFEWAHNDFSLQQFLEHRTTVADVYHHKIRSGWDERKFHVGKLSL